VSKQSQFLFLTRLKSHHNWGLKDERLLITLGSHYDKKEGITVGKIKKAP
jgi:hypothetical protein